MNKIFRWLNSEFHYRYWRRHVSERTVRRHHAARYSEQCAPAVGDGKTVVFMADGFRHCGGLADRLRGIVALYSFCRYMGLDFKINFTSPFKLEDYMLPAVYDWRLAPGELSFNSGTSKPVHLLTVDSRADYRREVDYQWRQLELATQGNFRQYHVYTAYFCGDDDFGRLFKELFRPAPVVQEQLDALKQELGEKYISVSGRFLELLGDFREPKAVQEELPEGEKVRLMDACIARIEELHAAHPGCEVFLTADSPRFLRYAMERLPYCHAVEGETAHIDVARTTDTHKADLKTFVDFFGIAGAQHSYLLIGPGMYRSNYSLRAAMAGDHPFDRVEWC